MPILGVCQRCGGELGPQGGRCCSNCQQIVMKELSEKCNQHGGQSQLKDEGEEVWAKQYPRRPEDDQGGGHSNRVIKKSLDTIDADPDAFGRADS